jgi:hypothetical protein
VGDTAGEQVRDLSVQPWPDDESVPATPEPPEHTRTEAAAPREIPVSRLAPAAAAAGAALAISVLLARRLRR